MKKGTGIYGFVPVPLYLDEPDTYFFSAVAAAGAVSALG